VLTGRSAQIALVVRSGDRGRGREERKGLALGSQSGRRPQEIRGRAAPERKGRGPSAVKKGVIPEGGGTRAWGWE